MKSFLKDYFTFTRSERNGVLVLLGIILLLLLAHQIVSGYLKPANPDFSQTEAEVADFLSSVNAQSRQEEKQLRNPHKKQDSYVAVREEIFFFDPNNLSGEEWAKLGLKPWQVAIIHNYERKGGKFSVKSDLRKIYGISEPLFFALEPYILLPESEQEEMMSFQPPGRNFVRERQGRKLELNSADTVKLKELRGIGSSFSRRIVKYRELLGGFCSAEQLMEVYGFTEEVLCLVEPDLFVDSLLIRKININAADENTLKAHPYIKWNVANAIVAYRNKHGFYQTVEDIRHTDLVDAGLYAKIAPYLTTE